MNNGRNVNKSSKRGCLIEVVNSVNKPCIKVFWSLPDCGTRLLKRYLSYTVNPCFDNAYWSDVFPNGITFSNQQYMRMLSCLQRLIVGIPCSLRKELSPHISLRSIIWLIYARNFMILVIHSRIRDQRLWVVSIEKRGTLGILQDFAVGTSLPNRHFTDFITWFHRFVISFSCFVIPWFVENPMRPL